MYLCVYICWKKDSWRGGGKYKKKELEIRYILKAIIQKKKRKVKENCQKTAINPQKTNSSVGMLVHSEQASSYQSYVDQVFDHKQSCGASFQSHIELSSIHMHTF